MSAPFPLAGEAAAILSSLCWAVAGILFMRIRPRPSAGAMNLGKNLTATACFLVFLLVVTGSPWPRDLALEPFLLFALSGFVGLAVCDSVLFRAFLSIGPRRTNVFMALWPAVVAVLAVFPPFYEHLHVAIWVGMAVTLAGVIVAALERPPDPGHRAILLTGARNAMFAAVLQAIGILLARRGHELSHVTVAEGATVRLVFGTVGLAGIGLATGRLGRWIVELRREGTWWKVAGAGFIATFLGIGSNQAGLAWAVHAGVAATLNSMAPIWLVPLSAAFLGEHHDRRAWISALLAVGGIALMTLVA